MSWTNKVKTAILASLMVVALSFSAFAADGALSLDELQQQAQETTAAVQSSGSQGSNSSSFSSDDSNGASAISNISKAAAMDTESETARKVGSTMNSWAAKIMQILGYVISIGLGIVTALDVIYISIPPLRGILANGYVGTGAQPGGGQPGMGGGMGMSGGMGGGMGMSGGMGMGMNRGMGGMGSAMGAQQNNQPATGRTQWVTNAALNAVAQATNGANPFKVYFKQQATVCILAPVIFVLAATGALSRLGFMMGQAVSTWMGNISF